MTGNLVKLKQFAVKRKKMMVSDVPSGDDNRTWVRIILATHTEKHTIVYTFSMFIPKDSQVSYPSNGIAVYFSLFVIGRMPPFSSFHLQLSFDCKHFHYLNYFPLRILFIFLQGIHLLIGWVKENICEIWSTNIDQLEVL